MEVLSEHQCQGWLAAIPADGAAWVLLLLLRGVYSHHRLDVQPARQVAETSNKNPWRRPVASFNYFAGARTLGGKTTTGSATRIPASSIMSSTRKPRSCEFTCRPPPNCLLSVDRSLLCGAGTTSAYVVAGKQPGAAVADHGSSDLAVQPKVSAFGNGLQRQGLLSPTYDGLLRDVPTLETLAAVELIRKTICRSLKVRVQSTIVDLMKLQPQRIVIRMIVGPRFRDALFTRGELGDLRLPRLSVADSPLDLSADRKTTGTSTFAASRMKARRRRGTDMVVMNELDRFHLVEDVIDRFCHNLAQGGPKLTSSRQFTRS